MRLKTMIYAMTAALLASTVASAAPIWFGPTHYTSEADRPAAFDSFGSCDQCAMVVEDFEDELIYPGLSLSPGMIIGPEFSSGLPKLVDSVDIDDGGINGSGNDGHSFYAVGNKITLTFDEPVTTAGVVWTDGPIEAERIILEAFDIDGNLIGAQAFAIEPDNSYQGTTDEDRFVGLQHEGIASLVVRQSGGGTGIEIDHITFSNCAICVPEPSSAILIVLGIVSSLAIRRRRQ
ncbi:MAG: PEP-CTERM sorting domain-containing protein [Planctomycetales bacterium]|nr:PEP-CTERM sorting domain-containing protein [Planctomycetales bacterium]